MSEILGRLLGAGFHDAQVVPETSSTNDDLKDAARRGAPEWSVLVARKQTAGRGRQGRRWESPEGNLYLSVLLRPQAASAGLLPLAAGVAVAEAIEVEGLDPRLKWPNDVLLQGKKVAGILAEGLSSGASLESVVLGLGVNLEVQPEGLQESTSIRAVLGRSPDVPEMGVRVLRRLRVWYDALRQEGPAPVLRAFRQRSVPWWGEVVEVISAGERVVGRPREIDPRGALVLEREDGSCATLLAGEARTLRPLSGI